MVAIGATASLLNLEDAVFQNVVDDIFCKRAKKSYKNMEAITRGRQIMNELLVDRIGEWELAPADGKRRMFMIGNDAIALGALNLLGHALWRHTQLHQRLKLWNT